ncbi:helix-turn-helix domain-containing protein [Marinomonas sp. GJ51-6]|nr:helix-turn-helix domain-containing protein [Marinomonas sp. GJ51-6]WOD06313.1 helix-turn-helix domain-containing protein [Marinomonas sp. GJ51-6]
MHLSHNALEKHQGNRTQAAKQLGISRQVLIKKIERYGL